MFSMVNSIALLDVLNGDSSGIDHDMGGSN